MSKIIMDTILNTPKKTPALSVEYEVIERNLNELAVEQFADNADAFRDEQISCWYHPR